MSISERLTNRWRDVANLVLGVWLVLSPWILAYTGATTAAWNAWIVGVVIAVAAFAALIAFHEWEEWVNAALAAWLIISPWVLGFTVVTAAMWNQIIVGLLVAALAIWSLVSARSTGELVQKH